jgi:hypothetical protein
VRSVREGRGIILIQVIPMGFIHSRLGCWTNSVQRSIKGYRMLACDRRLLL